MHPAWLLPDFEGSHLLFIFICKFIGKWQNMSTINHVCFKNLDVSSLLPKRFGNKEEKISEKNK